VLFKDDQAMFRQFVKKILFDLQAAKRKEFQKTEVEINELQEKVRNMEMELMALKKSNPGMALDIPMMSQQKVGGVGGGAPDNRKKKAQTDLINPNIKKRKVMGAKFGDSQFGSQ